jgi:NAD+ diphosphatase
MTRASIYKHFVPKVGGQTPDGSNGYWFAFSSSRLLVKTENSRLAIPLLRSLGDIGLKPIRTQYLGTYDQLPCYSAELPPDIEAPNGLSFSDLRAFYFGTEEDLFLLAGRALQIMAWDQTHQFCGRCGHPTETLPGETAKICPVCQFSSYPRISPAVIVAISKGDQILLTRYASRRSQWHTIIAGFLEPGETLEECVRREVMEEVGLEVKNINYYGNQPWPFPNSLMIGFTAEYAQGEIKVDGKEIAEAAWFHVDQIPEVPPKMSITRELIDWFVEQRKFSVRQGRPNHHSNVAEEP